VLYFIRKLHIKESRVLKQASKNNLLNRYNKAIVLVFTFIVLSASTVAYFRYYNELQHLEKESLETLNQQADTLNTMLEQSVQAITGMQDFANYYLKYPEELSARMPKLLQDEQLFYLDKPKRDVIGFDKRLSGNITGFGDISRFNLQQIEELAMANALTPAFISAKLTIPEATWFYYVSYNQFVNIYPWIDKENWHYTDKTLNNTHLKAIELASNKQAAYFWSPPYIDAAGSGLNSSLSVGVYREKQLVGAVVIDLNLGRLYENLPNVLSNNHGLVLLNKQYKVLINKQSSKFKLSPNTHWKEILPEKLAKLSIDDLMTLPDSAKVDGWLLQKKQLFINGWVLLQYQPYSEFSAPIFNSLVFISAVFFVGLVAFLSLVYLLTHRTFIQPTAEFINHIENCSQGDPGKIKPAAGWLHWFKIVEDIFSQNRSLLQLLKEQNTVLDRRVNDKTKALLESSEQHQQDYALLGSVMNAMPELIIFNDLQGRLIGCNQAFERFVNQNKELMLGVKVSSLMPKILGTTLDELSSLSMKENPKKAFSHQRIVETDIHTYDVFSRQFFNDRENSLGTINIFRDVTEQFSAQSALKKAKNQAVYANQAKSQFLANMSHEIRTPINAMQGMMELLDKTSLNSHQHHYLQNAQRASGSLLHLIDELLDLSRIEAGKMFISKEETNLDVIIETALKLNLGMANISQLTFTIDISSDVPQQVITDEMRLIQVLANLLNNAVKFTSQGEVKLTVEITAKRQRDVLIRFKVKDTGIGIAQDKQKLLFDAFNQADNSMTREYGGSGLGLSICQQIVNLLGGEITVQSELGVGSEFSFVIPIKLPSDDNVMVDTHDTSQVNKLALYGFSLTLSQHLKESINLLGWQYKSIDSLINIETMVSQEPIVILIEGSYLAQHSRGFLDELNCLIADLITENPLSERKILLAICQPVMSVISEDLNAQLALLSIPYILLDMPLYRYSLREISEKLRFNATPKIKNIEPTKIVTPNSNKQKNLAGVKVLLVEDNLVNQLVAKELLKNMQAEVIIADNGKIALDILNNAQKESTQKIDIVLMDIQMPVMDGLTASRLIRENEYYFSLPIIAMTAHAREEDKNNSLAAGMNLHIAKPVSTELLLKSIQGMLKDQTV
jgi:signal transduction histidine kinase/cell division protein FtsL